MTCTQRQYNHGRCLFQQKRSRLGNVGQSTTVILFNVSETWKSDVQQFRLMSKYSCHFLFTKNLNTDRVVLAVLFWGIYEVIVTNSSFLVDILFLDYNSPLRSS